MLKFNSCLLTAGNMKIAAEYVELSRRLVPPAHCLAPVRMNVRISRVELIGIV